MKALVLVLLLVNLSACTSLPLTLEEQQVKIVNTQPTGACKELGAVHIPGLVMNPASRFEDLKRGTAKLGGNTAYILSTNQNGTIDALALACGN